MLFDIFGLIFSLAIILIGCGLFTNSVEWFGKILHLGDGMVGSVLSAVGTCLPETMVPVVAILFSGGKSQEIDIGIGAIAGAPFMLSTLGFFITGSTALLFHKKRGGRLLINAKTSIMKRDIGFFTVTYILGILANFVPDMELRIFIAIFLLLSYIFYLFQTFRNDRAVVHEIDELYLALYLNLKPRLRVIILQISIALAGIIFGAHMFVMYIISISTTFGIPALVLSLIITPIATELPEKFNSVIWIARGKDTLAIGNITGAMVFQSCIPVSIGLLATSWRLTAEVLVSAEFTLLSAFIIYLWLRSGKRLNFVLLMTGGVFYIAFLAFIGKTI